MEATSGGTVIVETKGTCGVDLRGTRLNSVQARFWHEDSVAVSTNRQRDFTLQLANEQQGKSFSRESSFGLDLPCSPLLRGNCKTS